MARLRMTENDQSGLSTNPWEEELREREKEEEQEQGQQIQASQPIVPPKRSIPNTPAVPQTQAQKGLALIFVKIDNQIELLEKQLINVQAELLQARDMVRAVRDMVTSLNKPEARELLEVDTFTNYLRIGNRLKKISNNMGMIVPDHGRQVVRVQNAHNEGFIYNDHDPSERDSEPIISDATAREPRKPRIYEERTSSPDLDVSVSYESNVCEPSTHTDEYISPPPRRPHPAKGRYPPKARDKSRQPPRSFYGKRRGPIPRQRCTVNYAPKLCSSSSTDPDSPFYDDLTDSSDLEDRPRSPYHVRRRSLRSQRYPVSYHNIQSGRDLWRASAAKRRRRRPSSRPEASIAEFQRGLIREENQMRSKEPRTVLVEPEGTRTRSLEAILQQEQTLLLEKLYLGQERLKYTQERLKETQERLKATQRRQVVRFLAGDGNLAEGVNLKGNLWTRLKSKFVDHANKQAEDDILSKLERSRFI